MDRSKNIKVIILVVAIVAALAVPLATAQVTSQDNIADTLTRYADVSTLVKAVNSAGLGGTLASKGPYTLFAPTNTAFNKFTPNTINTLLQDKQKIGGIMAYHIVPGRLSISDLAGVSSVQTVDGRTLPVSVQDGYLSVGGARVLNRGVECTNGIIYPVDSIMIPPNTVIGAPAQYAPQQAQQPPAAAPGGMGGILLLGLLILGALLLGGLFILWLGWRLIKRLLGRPQPEYRYPVRTGYTRPPVGGEVREPDQFGTQSTPTLRDEGPYVPQGAATYMAPTADAITFDESAVNELKNMDASHLSGIRQYIIGSYNNFKDMLDFARAARIDLQDVQDDDAVWQLKDRYRLSLFNSNTLELALEKNATIYTIDPALMRIYRAAGAKVEDLRNLILRA